MDAIVRVYEQATDELLINIARKIDITDPTLGTVDWQMRQLAKLGKLTRENLRIILRHARGNPKLIEAALLRAAGRAIKATEPALQQAVKKGFLSDPGFTYNASPRVRRLLQDYAGQSKDKMNLVNTTMLQSSLDAYTTGVNAISRNVAQESLNLRTGQTVLGLESRRSAVRKAMADMVDAGITGFVDKAGRHWQAEAYIEMDIRTTVHNTYVKATMSRNEDYGNDLVYPGIKPVSRPLCYPWQGKVLSTSGRSGMIEDLDGNPVRIYPINETTYGQPAGIWGINCGHSCNPFIPGLTSIRGDIPDEGENDIAYEHTQLLRAYEREIRYAKRDAEIAKATNDKELYAEKMKLVRQRQKRLREVR